MMIDLMTHDGWFERKNQFGALKNNIMVDDYVNLITVY